MSDDDKGRESPHPTHEELAAAKSTRARFPFDRCMQCMLTPTAPVLAPSPAFRFPALCQPAASNATGKRPERDGTTSRYFEASSSGVDATVSDGEEAVMAEAEEDEIMCTPEMQAYYDEQSSALQRRNAYLAKKRARKSR